MKSPTVTAVWLTRRGPPSKWTNQYISFLLVAFCAYLLIFRCYFDGALYLYDSIGRFRMALISLPLGYVSPSNQMDWVGPFCQNEKRKSPITQTDKLNQNRMGRGSTLPVVETELLHNNLRYIFFLCIYLCIELICSTHTILVLWIFVNSMIRRLDVIYIVKSVLILAGASSITLRCSLNLYTELAKIRLSAIKFFLSTLSIFCSFDGAFFAGFLYTCRPQSNCCWLLLMQLCWFNHKTRRLFCICYSMGAVKKIRRQKCLSSKTHTKKKKNNRNPLKYVSLSCNMTFAWGCQITHSGVGVVTFTLTVS